ncbi:conserved hypothetical protein [Candida dubliniensis CD36]|uniref:Uncharacterized protein n=1 Tax=Candida dubliniensis (strain CD36 / ATCC MYA-646 / CBS 7987 / NCPF 3949 / NRRL Y-17841) TaxID=573826 RepID=B9WEY0_CANDC|nr:conserved hypothetical protein [Candida dubliniensis CD36]CAX43243.1 conserved hypothetical protein [Candida dubliniensis CD36]
MHFFFYCFFWIFELIKTISNNMSTPNNNEDKPDSSKDFDINDLAKLENITQKVLDPNNENPHMGEYIKGTFSYIANAMIKMQTTNDRQATAKEIADDLTQKFDNWVKNREEAKDNQTENTTSNKTEESK